MTSFLLSPSLFSFFCIRIPPSAPSLSHLVTWQTQKIQEGKKTELILLDAKRSNFINIGLKKLPPPRAIKTAILKMDTTIINREGIEKILTMIPTDEEKTTISEAQLCQPDLPLGTAENFLLTLSQIPALEQRLRLWSFKIDFDVLEKEMGEQLMDLKLAMEEIEKSETLKLVLGTLLAMGNFLNGLEVKGFQLEYLAKVPEVKDTVHKHSLLHHLVNFVLEKNGNSSDLYSELGAVTRASRVDYDELLKTLTKMESDCKLCWDHLRIISRYESASSGMKHRMGEFLTNCSARITVLLVVHRRVINRFKKTLLYLGFSVVSAKELKPQAVFKIISEFALEYRTTRERIKLTLEKKARHRSRSKTRSKLIAEAEKIAASNKFGSHNLRSNANGGHLNSSTNGTGTSTCGSSNYSTCNSDQLNESSSNNGANGKVNGSTNGKWGETLPRVHTGRSRVPKSNCINSAMARFVHETTTINSTTGQGKTGTNSNDYEMIESFVKTVTAPLPNGRDVGPRKNRRTSYAGVSQS